MTSGAAPVSLPVAASEQREEEHMITAALLHAPAGDSPSRDFDQKMELLKSLLFNGSIHK